jgi:alginate O-acetyltransferase complex protein AlgI
MTLPTAFQLAGVAHLVSLTAMIVAPVHLGWNDELARLPRLLRQMCNVYSLYTGGTIVACGVVSLVCANDLSSGSVLARAVSGYIALFWGVRLGLQAYYDFRPHLTNRRLRVGYHALTLLFATFTGFYGWVVFKR